MRRSLSRAAARGSLAVMLCVSGLTVRADPLLTAAIPAQPLATALAEFTHQTGLQLVYVSDVLAGQRTPGARAGVAAADALRALLQGTGLTFEFLNPRAVRIFPEPPKPAESARGATPPAQHAARPAGLEEIRVTGQRGENARAAEALQTVPSSVSLVVADALEAQKYTDLVDYAIGVPGMTTVTSGAPGQTQVILRGIFPFTSASPVAFYIDDVPVGGSGPYANANTLSLELMPYDFERLEVWRSPQGTLIGAESEMGLMRYVLAQPSVSDFGGVASADVFAIHGADTPGKAVFSAVNVPIVTGQLGLRASVYDNYLPGYIDNLYDGAQGTNVQRRRGGRTALRWQPVETLSVTFNALWNRISAQNTSQVSFNQVAVQSNTGDAYFVRQLGSWGDLVDNTALLAPQGDSLDLYSVSVHWTPGPVDVSSATAWSRVGAYAGSDATQQYGSFYPQWSNGVVPPGLALSWYNSSLSKFSEELHVAGHSGTRLEWSLGAFYTRESASEYQYLQALDSAAEPIGFFAPALFTGTQPSRFVESVAFGHATWHVTPKVDVTAGLRVANDYQSYWITTAGWEIPSTYVYGHSSETDASWMGAVRYRLTPETIVYAQAASGFQPGSPNGFQPGVPATVGGERTVTYELGVKAGKPHAAASADLAVFYVDWRDIQAGVFENNASFLTNGAQGYSKGVELTSTYAPVSVLQLTYNVAYTQCAIESTIPAADYIVPGYQLPDVPKWNMAASLAYTRPLASGWQAQLGSTVRSLGEQWNLPDAVQSRSRGGYPAVVMSPYWVIDANAGISRGRVAIRTFVRNVTDKRANLNRFAFLDANGTPVEIASKLLQPRTIGLGGSYSF